MVTRSHPLHNQLTYMSKLIKYIKRLIFAYRYKNAVKQAIKLHDLTGRKYFVIVMGGKPKPVSKRTIKQLIAAHRFRRGTTVRDIENRALFTTNP